MKVSGLQAKKVLIVVNDAQFFLSHRLPVAEGAQRAGFDVHVATPDGIGADRIRAKFTFHPVPLSRSGTSPAGELRTLVALWRVMRRVEPDLVHLVTMKPAIYGGLAARMAGVGATVAAVTGTGYVFTSKAPTARRLRPLVKLAYKTAMRHRNASMIFQNPDDRALFVDLGIVRADRTVLIRGSGVDMKRFAPSPEPPGTPVVTLAARMLWFKGVGTFVETARRLRTSGVKARMVLVGGTDPSNPSAVPEEVLERWSEEGVVEWWGHRDDMPAVMRASHVVVLPSVGEGVPKVLIEASASQRPIIATDAPGCREIVHSGESGLLIPLGDAGALAEAIETLVSDADLRQRFGRAGRELAASQFSVERVVRETLDLYTERLT